MCHGTGLWPASGFKNSGEVRTQAQQLATINARNSCSASLTLVLFLILSKLRMLTSRPWTANLLPNGLPTRWKVGNFKHGWI